MKNFTRMFLLTGIVLMAGVNTFAQTPPNLIWAKTFGGTDAFKFVNGVLDMVAAQARDTEIKAQSNVQPD